MNATEELKQYKKATALNAIRKLYHPKTNYIILKQSTTLPIMKVKVV